MHFYAPLANANSAGQKRQLVQVENFACGPLSWTQLKQKMADFVEEWKVQVQEVQDPVVVPVPVLQQQLPEAPAAKSSFKLSSLLPLRVVETISKRIRTLLH
jgi:hypothetical protein